MGVEIEKKFLIQDDSWRSHIKRSHSIRQAYMVDCINENTRASVRIRIEDDHADINIKSAELGITRMEFQYAIPLDEASQMLEQLCHHPVIEKLRHIVEYKGHTWEIDEFSGDNQGLIVAEIELKTADESFARPAWLGKEVSDDRRYYNVCLLRHPFSHWNLD